MDLPLDDHLSIGVQTLHRRTEPAEGPWLPTIDELADLVGLVDRCGYDSMWVGDHVAFTIAIFDPLLQLAQAAVLSRRLVFGTDVYLLPLRHPTPVAKQVSTLDHLTEGRFIFGVGVGGEFPKEYEACGVPLNERGARLERKPHRSCASCGPASRSPMPASSSISRASRCSRRRGNPAGPPIWCGGRADPALRRIGRMTDGWMSYVVTPDMYRQGLEKIATAASEAARTFDRGFGTAHLLFTRIDDTYEKALDAATVSLSQRYAMDFRKAAQRYCALGTPQDVVETIFKFQQAGVRHLILDFVGPYEERDQQIERFAAEAMPLLAGLRRR